MTDFSNRPDLQGRFSSENLRSQQRRGQLWTGALLLLIGAVALLRSLQVPLPYWIFTWQMFLIVLGLFIGLKHRFKGIAWFILMLVGVIFLANEYLIKGSLQNYVWPLILITVGLSFIIGSRRKVKKFEKKNIVDDSREQGSYNKESFSQDDFIDASSIFGSTRKNVVSKKFKGGDIVNVFGGTEINLTHSDIETVASIEITTIFGGIKLIVPSNWQVKSEAVAIFGGIEDKRDISIAQIDNEKILILKGTVIFGGIDIKSF